MTEDIQTREHPRFKDFPGQKFGRLTVVGLSGNKSGAALLWFCKCDCGTMCEATRTLLRKGAKKSCGCLKRESQHGMSGKGKPPCQRLRMYGVWKGMKSRCNTKKATGHHNYGGRGIKVCERWNSSFINFREDVLKLLSPGETDIPKGFDIDRIRNADNYEPGNVRLVTREKNLRNKRDNVCIELDGETKTLTEWCLIYKAKFSRVRYRIKTLGWDAKRALTEPRLSAKERRRHGTKNVMLTHDGKTMCIAAWAELLGMNAGTLRDRLKDGWSVEKALTQPVRPC